MQQLRSCTRILLVSASLFFFVASCPAQKLPQIVFDISSVKPAQGESARGSIRRLDVGAVSVSSMTVSELIGLFYHLRPYQITGGPKWINVTRFDVTGKDSTLNASSNELKAKHWSEALDAEDEEMQKLLENRFDLRLHHQAKQLPAFSLLADPKKQWAASPCSSEYRLEPGFVRGSIRIASLAALLKVELGMPVLNETELEGCYEFNTHWTTNPDDGSVPYITTALRQMGLRLQKTKADVDTVVIDHVALPLPD